jgi:hypothetical protein
VPFLVVVLTVDLGFLAGSAYAYLSATGTGSGHATIKAQPVVVEQATVAPGLLFPGQEAGLSLKLTNPNHFALKLVGVSEAVGTTVAVVPATASCTGSSAGVSVATTVSSGLGGYTIKAHTTTTGVTNLTVATGAAMTTSSPSACQTKSFHIKVTVTVRS